MKEMKMEEIILMAKDAPIFVLALGVIIVCVMALYVALIALGKD